MKNGIGTGELENGVQPVQGCGMKNGSGIEGVVWTDRRGNGFQACGMENGGNVDTSWSTVEACAGVGNGNCWLDNISTPSSSDTEDPVQETLGQLLEKK